VDDSEVERKLLAHYLKPTKITLTSIPSGDDPIAAVKASNVDLVLCEANLKAMTGEQLIAQLRTAGYAGRVIVITSETKGDRLRALKQAGATGMLGKPYDQAKLFSLIGAFLKRVAADTGVVSALAAQPEMKSLIERYVANVQQLAKDIEAAMRENQIDRIRHICNSLKGSGTSYGFAVLSDSAKETMRALDATMSMQESDEQIKKLLDLCKRVIIR
jgi:CheY-like chemotaxis protein